MVTIYIRKAAAVVEGRAGCKNRDSSFVAYQGLLGEILMKKPVFFITGDLGG